MEIYSLTGNGFEKMQYEVELKDLQTGKTFKKYFKNEYHLRLFTNKVARGKKLIILDIKDLWR